MAQMMKSKVGSRKKGRRSSKKKPYYAAYRAKNVGKQIRARANREKRIAAAKEHPEIGSPSQLKHRGIKNKIPRSSIEAMRLAEDLQHNSDIMLSKEIEQKVLDIIDS